ncbi:MAG: hypothetical protein HOE75_01500 [Chloroflexi bacterium]|nr:hypothetical protein [Chloroflexota bacterium]
MPVKVTGINELKRLLKTADVKIVGAVAQEMSQITDAIAQESRGLVPFDEGILSGSQVVTKKPTPVGFNGSVEYGGPAAPYALIQHENEDYFHPAKSAKPPGTGPGIPGQTRAAKYLEMPAKRHQATVVPRLIAAIKRVT